MSRLVDFYRGIGTDSEGRLLEDILAWPDDELEAVHDFIQWLFALPEPSQFNSDAPLLTDADIAAFKSDLILQANLTKSFERILAFLGLSPQTNGEVVEGEKFKSRVPLLKSQSRTLRPLAASRASHLGQVQHAERPP